MLSPLPAEKPHRGCRAMGFKGALCSRPPTFPQPVSKLDCPWDVCVLPQE